MNPTLDRSSADSTLVGPVSGSSVDRVGVISSDSDRDSETFICPVEVSFLVPYFIEVVLVVPCGGLTADRAVAHADAVSVVVYLGGLPRVEVSITLSHRNRSH